jgi:hypothetical protein
VGLLNGKRPYTFGALPREAPRMRRNSSLMRPMPNKTRTRRESRIVDVC